ARIREQVRRGVPRDVRGAVLGLAYKPFSHVIEESQAIMITKAFLEHGARVLAYDPLAGEAANLELGGRALIMDNVCDCLRGADVGLVATPDPEFRKLTVRDFRSGGRPLLVVDFWGILSEQLSGAAEIDYLAYGRGGNDPTVLQQLWGEIPTHYGR